MAGCVPDSTALSSSPSVTSFSVPLTGRWGEGIVSFEAGSELDLDVRLESVHEGILVTGEAEGEYVGVCGRCLTDIARPVEVEFQEPFAYPGEEQTDFAVQDDPVDLETLVRDPAVLALPFQPVCQPVTGERLTESTGTEQAAPIDPRWSALQQITDQDGTAERGAAEKEES